MNTLHNKSEDDILNAPKEGQPDLLCSNKKSSGCPSLSFKIDEKMERRKVSDSDLKTFIEFGKILKRIHTRLMVEGYVIKDGNLYKT